jgi:hypothetical protein
VDWIATAPAPGSMAPLANWLAELTPSAFFLWIACHGIGSILLIPLTEELAFRGCLYRAVVSYRFEQVSFGTMSWVSLLQLWNDVLGFVTSVVYCLRIDAQPSSCSYDRRWGLCAFDGSQTVPIGSGCGTFGEQFRYFRLGRKYAAMAPPVGLTRRPMRLKMSMAMGLWKRSCTWLSLRRYSDRQRICVATGGEWLGIGLRCDRNPQVSCWSAARSR